MKYTNETTRKLLKEFRTFVKWSPKNIYSMKGDQQKTFNKNISVIIKEAKE